MLLLASIPNLFLPLHTSSIHIKHFQRDVKLNSYLLTAVKRSHKITCPRHKASTCLLLCVRDFWLCCHLVN